MNLEPSIRVITTFYAALIGFGLKRMLDLDASQYDIATQKWAIFLLAVLLLLRFLVGSANHLWVEYVGPENNSGRLAPPLRRAGLDFAFLILFGLLAVYMLYANSVTTFLVRGMTLIGAALLWTLIDAYYRHYTSMQEPVGDWVRWGLINSAHFLAVSVAWYLLRSCAPGKESPSLFCKDVSIGSPSLGFPLYLNLNWVLAILILISMILLADDFRHQAEQLQAANNRNPYEQASRSESGEA